MSIDTLTRLVTRPRSAGCRCCVHEAMAPWDAQSFQEQVPFFKGPRDLSSSSQELMRAETPSSRKPKARDFAKARACGSAKHEYSGGRGVMCIRQNKKPWPKGWHARPEVQIQFGKERLNPENADQCASSQSLGMRLHCEVASFELEVPKRALLKLYVCTARPEPNKRAF